jgi:hypothetical protein
VQVAEYNAQEQTHIVWPPTFALARAYLDQLERNGGLSTERISAIRSELANAESASGAARSTALTATATSLSTDVATASDKGRVRLLQRAVQDLAKK